jgi:hypothetical protein
MDRFVHGLSNFAGACRADLTGFHVQEESLDAAFRGLQHSVKHSLLGSTRPPPIDATRTAVKSHRRRAPPDPGLPVPAGPQIARRGPLQPMAFPVRSYALRVQPCMAAVRLYRPKARERIEGDRLDLIDEYAAYPTPEVAQLLDGKIDPALRVGSFHADELRWNGRVPVDVV